MVTKISVKENTMGVWGGSLAMLTTMLSFTTFTSLKKNPCRRCDVS